MKILIFLLPIMLIAMPLLADESAISFRNIHLKEVMYDWELVDEYSLGTQYNSIYFTKSTLNDSGTLKMIVPFDNRSTLIKLDEYFDQQLLQKNFESIFISKYGDFYRTFDGFEINENTKSKVYSLYNQDGIKVWEKNIPENEGMGELNDSGTCLSGDAFNKVTVIPITAESFTIGPFYNEKSIQHLIPAEYICSSLLSNKGELVVLASENRNKSSEYYHSFPLGSRLFFYLSNGELVKTYDLEGTNIWWPYKFSDSGKYFVLRNDPFMYLFKNNDLILKKDIGRLNKIVFSEDESIVFISSQDGNFIINPETAEILSSTDFGGQEIAIANRDYPIVACIIVNEVYISNYETGEVLLKDVIYPRFDSNRPKLQISGDGKTLSVAYNNLFRKYKIGGRK